MSFGLFFFLTHLRIDHFGKAFNSFTHISFRHCNHTVLFYSIHLSVLFEIFDAAKSRFAIAQSPSAASYQINAIGLTVLYDWS